MLLVEVVEPLAQVLNDLFLSLEPRDCLRVLKFVDVFEEAFATVFGAEPEG